MKNRNPGTIVRHAIGVPNRRGVVEFFLLMEFLEAANSGDLERVRELLEDQQCEADWQNEVCW
jgi:hypothetical protein